jgi:hypothetical protein
MAREFLLQILPRPDGHYGVELRQRLNGAGGQHAPVVVRAWGPAYGAAVDHILEALRRCGYRASDVHRGRRAPFELREAWGVRVALLLLALKPLRKTSRMERIAEAIREMPDEEAYYWFSKTTAAVRGQRALRILLAGE